MCREHVKYTHFNMSFEKFKKTKKTVHISLVFSAVNLKFGHNTEQNH